MFPILALIFSGCDALTSGMATSPDGVPASADIAGSKPQPAATEAAPAAEEQVSGYTSEPTPDQQLQQQNDKTIKSINLKRQLPDGLAM